MFYTIYKVTNLINNKIYIGKHQTKNPHDSYYGSGYMIRTWIEKYGKENFKKEILLIFDNEKEMNMTQLRISIQSVKNVAIRELRRLVAKPLYIFCMLVAPLFCMVFFL